MTDAWAQALLAPRSVAVYGASRTEGKLGHTLLRNVLEGGFDGEVTPINPAGGTVLGLDATTSLSAAADLALVSVPAAHAVAAVRDAARAGCRATVILSSGFGEASPEGRAAEQEATRIAADVGMRLVGPNCMGVLSRLDDGHWLNGTYFWNVPTTPGPVSFVSQSGAFGGMFFSEASDRGFGLARFLSLGNAADVTATDVLEFLATDEKTAVIGLFAEEIGDGRRFVDVARSVTARKPLVVLKGGKFGAGARAAASHTGSLAGNHGAVQAAFLRAGVTEAADSDAFFDALAAAASGLPIERGHRVAVLTISGGPAVLAADAAERAHLQLPTPSESTEARLREVAPTFAALGNPIDLTPQCPPEHFGEAAAAVFDDDAVDGVIVINCGLDLPEFGDGVAAAATRTGKPTTAYLLDVPTVDAALANAGIPRFGSPERAVAGYATGVRR